jgi:hypothetical protein
LSGIPVVRVRRKNTAMRVLWRMTVSVVMYRTRRTYRARSIATAAPTLRRRRMIRGQSFGATAAMRRQRGRRGRAPASSFSASAIGRAAISSACLMLAQAHRPTGSYRPRRCWRLSAPVSGAPCPISACGGLADDEPSRDDLEAWDCPRRGSLALRTLRGR